MRRPANKRRRGNNIHSGGDPDRLHQEIGGDLPRFADPPPGSVRWGRRVCAGAVHRGVLLRPLGDVVVVMPPLTTTAAEIDRVIDALAESISSVAAEDSATEDSR